MAFIVVEAGDQRQAYGQLPGGAIQHGVEVVEDEPAALSGEFPMNVVVRMFHVVEEAVGGIREGKQILLEGQLGSLKDTDNGIYPMVTSSSPLAGFACVGAGIPPYAISDVITVVKAYSSAVGAGAFVSEILDPVQAEELRRRGGDKGEYGATTGRPRRVGWFDAVATRYGCMMQGATEVALTNIDVLGYLDEIPVCAAYELDGRRIDAFPVTPLLEKCKPVIEKLPGWKCDIRGCTDYQALPQQAKAYVDFLESRIGYPITLVSTGPKRNEITVRQK